LTVFGPWKRKDDDGRSSVGLGRFGGRSELALEEPPGKVGSIRHRVVVGLERPHRRVGHGLPDLSEERRVLAPRRSLTAFQPTAERLVPDARRGRCGPSTGAGSEELEDQLAASGRELRGPTRGQDPPVS